MRANYVPLSPISFLQRSGDVYPDSIAVRDRLIGQEKNAGSETVTYAEFRSLADRLSGAVRGFGLEYGARVAVLSRNSLAMLALHYGVPGGGGVLVPLNTRLSPQEYRAIIEHCEAALLFVDREVWAGVAGELSGLPVRAVVEMPGLTEANAAPRTIDMCLGSFIERYNDGSGMQLPSDELDPIAINYTSGTTGKPKGAVYTHRGAYLNAMGQALEFGLSVHDRYLWTLPMFHCNGWCFTWAVTAVGARHVILQDFEPDVALRLIHEEGITRFCGAPVVLNAMAASELADGLVFDQQVIGAVGGAPPSPSTLKAMYRLGVEVLHLYGLTETYGPSIACETQPTWDSDDVQGFAQKLSRQGVRTINVQDVRVVDESLETVPRDATTMGEIAVQSNTVMKGYFRDDDLTREALDRGWFLTGDLAVVHPDGYIEIRDRRKDIIISGGENVSSIQVENVLMEHPAVSEAAVVGRADERWGEVPVAFVAVQAGSEVAEAELIEWVRDRLAHFKAPKEVVVGPLPKTSTGKIQKFELRQELRRGGSQ